jgi:hypothetical protein
MRTQIDSGSIVDRLNAVAMTLQECEDLPVVAWKWGRIVRALELIVDRAAVIRRRGGSLANLAGPLTWLDQVVRDHPALQEPGAEPVAEELQRLIDRIRDLAGA